MKLWIRTYEGTREVESSYGAFKQAITQIKADGGVYVVTTIPTDPRFTAERTEFIPVDEIERYYDQYPDAPIVVDMGDAPTEWPPKNWQEGLPLSAEQRSEVRSIVRERSANLAKAIILQAVILFGITAINTYSFRVSGQDIKNLQEAAKAAHAAPSATISIEPFDEGTMTPDEHGWITIPPAIHLKSKGKDGHL